MIKKLADFAELKLLIDEYNPANSDWNFRRGVLLDILVRIWPQDASLAERRPFASDEPCDANQAWHELVEKDDRTSPEEYPDMCLITFDELKEFMTRSRSPAACEINGCRGWELCSDFCKKAGKCLHAERRSQPEINERYHEMYRETVRKVFAEREKALAELRAQVEEGKSRVKEACDLLAERAYGNAARSPGHNARLRLEGWSALSSTEGK